MVMVKDCPRKMDRERSKCLGAQSINATSAVRDISEDGHLLERRRKPFETVGQDGRVHLSAFGERHGWF